MESSVVSGLGEIFPWVFRREAYIFEAFDKLHVVLRVGTEQPIVIRESEASLDNTRTFLSSMINASGSVIELLELCTLENDLKRAVARGGAVVFRNQKDLPKEIEAEDIVSLSQALESF